MVSVSVKNMPNLEVVVGQDQTSGSSSSINGDMVVGNTSTFPGPTRGSNAQALFPGAWPYVERTVSQSRFGELCFDSTVSPMSSLENERERTLLETRRAPAIYYTPVGDDAPFFLSLPFTISSGTQ
jgi:hypothetical protein